MRPFTRLIRFTGSDWLLAMEAWCELWRAAMLARMPFGRQKLLQRAMSSGAMTRPTGRLNPIQIAALVEAVDRGRRYHAMTMNCLEQSLALVWMLRRRGFLGILQIGCRRAGLELRFHAWVAEANGWPIKFEETESLFVPFALIPCESGSPA